MKTLLKTTTFYTRSGSTITVGTLTMKMMGYGVTPWKKRDGISVMSGNVKVRINLHKSTLIYINNQ